jgi:tRNA pseudouridine(55) synthase
MSEEKYITLSKKVGETPLQVLENWRQTRPDLVNVPLAYAGRLDPMASGQLLVLIGEECKKQTEYHNLDKTYEVEVLFGVRSDSGDVLGLVSSAENMFVLVKEDLESVLSTLVGEIELPYPIFSSKTINGKPLHTWAVEGRLNEVTIPTRKSEIYKLSLLEFYTKTRSELTTEALNKIELIPPVTDLRKAIGNDFRRVDVRLAWKNLAEVGDAEDIFHIAKISCTCSSGTYMRTLAEVIANKLNTDGLAYSINRSQIGKYDKSKKTWMIVY